MKDKVILGDSEAFKEWMNIKIRPIELFAVQYGVSQKEAGYVAESVFKDLYRNLGELTTDQIQEKYLFESAIQKLNEIQSDEQQVGLFPFEEDNKLHRRIIGIPSELRIPFILSNFHGKSTVEIVDFVGKTDEQVELAINEAFNYLSEPNLEKKIEFLNLSYQRLPAMHNEMNIFYSNNIESTSLENKMTEDKPKRKRPMLLWGIGVSILAMMLLVMTVTKSEAYQQSSLEKFIEKSTNAFSEELDRNKKLAGLPTYEVIRRDVYSEEYGENTRRKFDWLIADLKDQFDSTGKFDKRHVEIEFDILMQELLIPSEMVKNLSENPLFNDHEKSEEFIDEYIVKMSSLLRSYMHIGTQYEMSILESGRNDEGGFDWDTLNANISDLPEELQQTLNGMEALGIVFKGDSSAPARAGYIYVYPAIGNSNLSKTLQENLHPDVGIYISILMADMVDIHEWTVEEQADLLLQLEKGLFQAEGHEFHSMVFNSYTSVMYMIIGMGGYLDIYDTTDSVKEEYREVWKSIAAHGDDSPSAQLMKEIIEEMENSGWAASTLNKYQYFTLENELRKRLQEDK
ncbi:hypothetical protein QTL97_11755 [Sporosarcina thermotolerans]|uniref:Type VII secretion protein EssB n=1 Tax=Sporosarcina thermotolerans TaxID=633404 RepID=A0AAW9A981_9BACL|nr:hypothetical protein [Sporosarcina thermotolerans]MDW0117614.1 hypothetical protein [Sporosarcina thermotolerans]